MIPANKDTFDFVLSWVQKVGRLGDVPQVARFGALFGAQEGGLWVREEGEKEGKGAKRGRGTRGNLCVWVNFLSAWRFSRCAILYTRSYDSLGIWVTKSFEMECVGRKWQEIFLTCLSNNRGVHSSHFWSIFDLIFLKNGMKNGARNEVKNDWKTSIF